MYQFAPLKNKVELKISEQNIVWGDLNQFVLFAGPDIVEDEGLVLEVASELKKITSELNIPWVLKCSYDKANRTSGDKYRGQGIEKSLKTLSNVKAKVGCALLTDIHETQQVPMASEVADVLQIPAFLCRQTDLLVAAAKTNKVIHIKKGQFMAPWDMKSVCEKVSNAGNEKILLCERGTSFGYNRLINDMTGLIEMRRLGYPVIMDITHSTQRPAAQGDSSGGQREFSLPLGKAALAIGVDGIFMETHPDPDKALCDGPTSIQLSDVTTHLKEFQKVWATHGV